MIYTLDSVIHCSNNAVPEPGGEETRSGTEKRCSHNLQSGHLALWSADNNYLYCSISKVNILEARSELAEEIFQ